MESLLCVDKQTLVLVATYNERSNIGILLDAILALPRPDDVLVVDDDSPDGQPCWLTNVPSELAGCTLSSEMGAWA